MALDPLVNGLLLKHLDTSSNDLKIAKGIPIKWIDAFQKVTRKRKAKKVLYRYRGGSIPGVYKRPQANCHKEFATSFDLYHRK